MRRGGYFTFLEFVAFELKKMLLHIFRAESGALAKRRGRRPGKCKSRECNETGRGFKCIGFAALARSPMTNAQIGMS